MREKTPRRPRNSPEKGASGSTRGVVPTAAAAVAVGSLAQAALFFFCEAPEPKTPAVSDREVSGFGDGFPTDDDSGVKLRREAPSDRKAERGARRPTFCEAERGGLKSVDCAGCAPPTIPDPPPPAVLPHARPASSWYGTGTPAALCWLWT